MVFDKIIEYLQYILNRLTGIFVKQEHIHTFMLDDDELKYGRLSDDEQLPYKFILFTN